MKQKSISFRVSEKEYEQISQRANESNQSVSKYVLNSALAGNGITLQQKQEIYKNLCLIKDHTLFNSDLKKIPKVCDEIWQLLK